MDPSELLFDIEAYQRKTEIEERYIMNRFTECRKKSWQENNATRSKRKYLNRDHPAANQRLIDDYFSNEPIYDDAMFRHRYRMQKHVFLRIVGDLSSSDNYFTQRVDGFGKEGISPLAKCTTAMRMLAYVASHDLWIWHAFFGCPGTLNDRSPVFDDVEQGNAPSVNFFVNGRPYNMAYYLADGIYPSYPTFVKSIRLPRSEPDKLFAKYHEGCRKDIERAFGVLQARFKIIREPARLWDMADLAIITRSCIILHNMIVEDERDTYAQHWTDFDQSEASGSSTPQPYSTEVLPAFANHVRARSEFRDPNAHLELQADLVKHIWAKFGMFRH
ncbi:hypothetical protein QQ045_020463 [Rhodiola kirilowii]